MIGFVVAGLVLVQGLPHEGPPFIRTGSDVISLCRTASLEDAYRCAGMLETLADRTEAARWKDGCPPMIEAVPAGTPPYIVRRALQASKDHPDWLKLTAASFVDRVERQARCHPTPP